MTTPDDERGLDPGHILAICTHATSQHGGQPVHAVARPGGVSACLPSRLAGRGARDALARIGYTVATAGNGRDLLVTGWSPGGLETRLAAMRAVLHQLAGHPSITARAVVEQFRNPPSGPPSPRPGEILEQAQARLRAWVSARSGIHAPHDPAVQPADVGNALRLRAAWALEAAIDDLIERHLRAAGFALALYGFLRTQMSGDRAQDTAIRRAGITFHLTGSTAQDSSALLQSAVRPPGSGLPPAVRPVSRQRAEPGQAASPEFPVTATSGAAPPARPPMTRVGGRHLPAGHPRPRR